MQTIYYIIECIINKIYLYTNSISIERLWWWHEDCSVVRVVGPKTLSGAVIVVWTYYLPSPSAYLPNQRSLFFPYWHKYSSLSLFHLITRCNNLVQHHLLNYYIKPSTLFHILFSFFFVVNNGQFKGFLGSKTNSTRFWIRVYVQKYSKFNCG